MRNNRKNTLAGSPPQVRGKLRMSGCRLITVRITPAGAGKTLSAVACLNIGEDHPRRCGENGLQPNAERKPTGSPPQVRGKQTSRNSQNASTRITPAGAGKTWTMEHMPAMDEDHPRRCGENSHIGFWGMLGKGSPPQVRGKLYHHCPYMSIFRITPAGAGKTFASQFPLTRL